jgi:hypothetical protein
MPNKFCINKFITAVDGYDLDSVLEISEENLPGDDEEDENFLFEDDENISREDLIRNIKNIRKEAEVDDKEYWKNYEALRKKLENEQELQKHMLKDLEMYKKKNEELLKRNEELTKHNHAIEEMYDRVDKRLLKLADDYDNLEKRKYNEKRELRQELEEEKLKVQVLEEKLSELHKTVVRMKTQDDTKILLLQNQLKEKETITCSGKPRGRSRRKYRGKKSTTAAP